LIIFLLTTWATIFLSTVLTQKTCGSLTIMPQSCYMLKVYHLFPVMLIVLDVVVDDDWLELRFVSLYV
jgi:heme A synthase